MSNPFEDVSIVLVCLWFLLLGYALGWVIYG